MFVQRRRFVAAAQLALVTTAVAALAHRNQAAEPPSPGRFLLDRLFHTRGWPVVWLATHNGGPGYNAPSRPNGDRVIHIPAGAVGANPAIPLAALAVAVATPTLAFGGRPFNRRAAVAVVAGVAGLAAAATELETAWEGDGWYHDFTPGSLVGEALGINRTPATKTGWYLREVAVEVREVVFDGALGPSDHHCRLWLYRTLFTAWAMLCFGGAAAVWWKPWRAPTTPPPA